MSDGLPLAERAPLYAKVAQEIFSRIGRGEYKLGALLPSEHQLCAQFGVSRMTVRGALHELELSGIISRQAGIGTRVARTAPRQRFVHESSSIEEVLQFTEEMIFTQLAAARITLDEAQAAATGEAPGASFMCIEGLRLTAAGLCICHSTHYLPMEFAAALPSLSGQKGSIATAIAAHFSLELEELEQTIEAINLDAAMANLLGVPENDAALSTWRCYRVESRRLLLATRSLFPKDRYSYVIRNRRDRAQLGARTGQAGFRP